MGNKGNRRYRRLETPSPSREENVETPNPGNITLNNSDLVDQENLGPNILENQLTEPSLISSEIQVWTQEMERRNNDRIGKMREEIDGKFEAILKEIKTSKNASTITNPRSESNETQNTQPWGSRNRSIGVHASENDNSDSENEDSHPIRASNMHELRNPARPFCQNRFELDGTIVSNKGSEDEDYHMVTEVGYEPTHPKILRVSQSQLTHRTIIQTLQISTLGMEIQTTNETSHEMRVKMKGKRVC